MQALKAKSSKHFVVRCSGQPEAMGVSSETIDQKYLWWHAQSLLGS